MKPKILIVVDNHFWCWTTSMKNLAYYLPEYDTEIISCFDFKMMPDYSRYDFIYLRGYASAFIDKNNEDKMIPFISTLTTGGERLAPRMAEMEKKARQGWGLIVQNKTAYHKCKQQGYKNISLIPSAVNCNVFNPQSGPLLEPYYVGMAGNMRGERANLKGKPFVEEACNKIEDIYYLETNIENPLSYEQMAQFYKNLFVYAQPSDSEGCSNSVMEAMATGIPCLIVEGVGYHGEICLDGFEHESGQVVFVKRDVNDIKEKIIMLLEDKEAYKRISHNAREFAVQHDWKYICLEYKKLFREFLTIARKVKPKKRKVIVEREFNLESNNGIAETVETIIGLSKKEMTALEVVNTLDILGALKEKK